MNYNCKYRTWRHKWVFALYVFRCHQPGDVTWFLLQFVLLRCAISSQLRNSSAFTSSHSDNSTATSSATRKYGTSPERPSKKEERSCINVPKCCKMKPDVHFSMKPRIICIFSLLWWLYWCFLIMGNLWFLTFLLIRVFFCVGAGISLLMSFSHGLGSKLFLSEDGKGEAYEGRNGGKGVFIPPALAFFCFYS